MGNGGRGGGTGETRGGKEHVCVSVMRINPSADIETTVQRDFRDLDLQPAGVRGYWRGRKQTQVQEYSTRSKTTSRTRLISMTKRLSTPHCLHPARQHQKTNGYCNVPRFSDDFVRKSRRKKTVPTNVDTPVEGKGGLRERRRERDGSEELSESRLKGSKQEQHRWERQGRR